MKAHLVALLVIANIADARAEEWVRADIADGGQAGTVEVFVDVDSIVRRDDFLRYRSYWWLQKPARTDDGKTYVQVLAEHEVRCADYVRYNTVVQGYDNQGQQVYLWQPPVRVPSTKYGSAGEVSARIVCGR